jgi:tetratricopeptide (TPR) repeat protein
MPDNVMFQEAIEAVRQGQRSRARDLLTRLLRADQNNPEYWLWLSAVVDTLKEQIFCLQSVLRLDPGNPKAKRGLVLLGAAAPGDDLIPNPPVRRRWETSLPEEAEKPHGIKAFFANPFVRAGSFASLGIAVVALLMAGAFSLNSRPTALVSSTPTRTFGPTPTYTLTPTYVATVQRDAPAPTRTRRPATPTPTPLGMLTHITPSPTALYVNTPHNISEAYRVGQRALERGSLDEALNYFQQASALEPNSPDLYYYLGETFRLMGNYDRALKAYNQAITADPNFGPAYVGRVLTNQALNPKSKIGADLDLAIEKDSEFGLAYLERAAYRLAQADYEGALEDLQNAEELLPGSPRVHLYRSQISLADGDFDAAMLSAREAINADPALLPAYQVLGLAAYERGQMKLVIEALEVYVFHEALDADAWMSLSAAYYQEGLYHDAVAGYTAALKLDNRLRDAHLFRGLAYLELDEAKKAVNDLLSASRFDSRFFPASVSLGRALFSDGRIVDARSQLNASEKLAKTDAELAQVYYWRAQVLEAGSYNPGAVKDWQALLALPKRAVPEDWRKLAQAHLDKLVTPTPKP